MKQEEIEAGAVASVMVLLGGAVFASVALKVISSVLRKTKEMLHHKEEPTDGGHKYEDEIITINNWWINEYREEALDQALLIIENGCKPSDVLECMMSNLLDNLELNHAFKEYELFAGKLADRMAEEHAAASKRIGWRECWNRKNPLKAQEEK